MASIPKKTQLHLFVGTYAQANDGGIYHVVFDTETGQLEINNSVKGVINPSYLSLDYTKNKLYAVSETKEGSVVSFSIDPSSYDLTEINRRSTNGADPCYVSLNQTGDKLYYVNYSGGSLGVFPILHDGAIGELQDFVQLSGHSVNPDRQEAPHAHTIVTVPSQPFQLVTDLGSDKIKLYQTTEDGSLILKNEVSTVPGSGPRHITFHPSLSLFYVIQELDSTIAVFELDTIHYQMNQIQTISTLPNDYSKSNTTADIHLSLCGNYLYGSNRGHDSIITYRIQKDGRLETQGHTYTGGQTPRNFTIMPDGKHLLVANQDSNNIVVMKCDESGIPTPTGTSVQVPKPVCIKVL